MSRRASEYWLCTAMMLLTLAWPSAAAAHDSLAPRGAVHQWLPSEEWVMRHWIPFDQRRLEEALGFRGRMLEAYLFNDHHTLAELARRRGSSARALADELIEPWNGTVDPSHVAVLRGRTLRILTQGHLAQHLFFHVFHSLGSRRAAHEVFGTSSRHLQSLRMQGDTPLAVARRHGMSRRQLTEGVLRLLEGHHHEGIRTKEAWPAQSDLLLARQIDTLDCWLRSPAPWRDRGNPYGKAMWQHGRHDATWPSTARDRRSNEQRVERVRRKLRWTCWPKVPAWSWATVPGPSGT